MHPNIHRDFILSPITALIKDVLSASAGIGDGIETFPLCDYVMQSAFIKMTGFQEQKLKCICWEMASVDFEYRYDYSTKPLAERSAYNDKQTVFKDLVGQIKKRLPSFNIPDDIDKDKILNNTDTSIIFNKTNLSVWSQKRFNEYEKIWEKIEKKHFATNDNDLFTEINNGISLTKIYKEYLYKHRNRIAHNTQSYQQNLPTLKTLINPDYRYENYFLWFSMLVLIDEIFIELYNKYLKTFDDN
jgi:hypothetical protein